MRRASAGLKAVQRAQLVSVEVVQHQPYRLCVRVCIINQPPHLMSEVHSSAPLGHLDMPPASFRLTEHEQVSSAVSLVLVVISFHPTRLGPDDRSLIGHQLPGCLVETDHGMVRVVVRGTGPARPPFGTPRSPPGCTTPSSSKFDLATVSRECSRQTPSPPPVGSSNPRVLRVRRCTRWRCASCLPSLIASVPVDRVRCRVPPSVRSHRGRLSIGRWRCHGRSCLVRLQQHQRSLDLTGRSLATTRHLLEMCPFRPFAPP